MLIFNELMFVLLHFILYSDKVSVSKYALGKRRINMGKNKDYDEEEMYVTLTLEDDSEVECLVLTIFEVEGQDYIVLLPEDDADAEEGEVFIYRYFEDEEGNPGLDNIESEEEFNMVSEVFDQIVEDGEYDEDVEVDDTPADMMQREIQDILNKGKKDE